MATILPVDTPLEEELEEEDAPGPPNSGGTDRVGAREVAATVRSNNTFRFLSP